MPEEFLTPPCADPELTREWPDNDDERCPHCNAKHGEPCGLENYARVDPRLAALRRERDRQEVLDDYMEAEKADAQQGRPDEDEDWRVL